MKTERTDYQRSQRGTNGETVFALYADRERAGSGKERRREKAQLKLKLAEGIVIGFLLAIKKYSARGVSKRELKCVLYNNYYR